MKEIHKKIWATYFNEVTNGKKTFELRLANWECSEGDVLILDEVDDETKELTGRSIRKSVGYIVKTKDLLFWTNKEVVEYGYQIISLIDEK